MRTHVDLFSGIGGFSLGLERAGFKTVVFCEQDKFCQKVLKKHWPEIPIEPDIKTFDGKKYAGAFILTGGFPCQPTSLCGKRKGMDDARWLWPDMLRIINTIRPRWCIAENPYGLLTMGLDEILDDLEASSYETTVLGIPACAIGGWHERQRLWIIAHDTSIGMEGLWPEGFKVSCTLDRPLLSLRNSDGQWEVEPDLCRINDGVSNRVDRLKSLGNAVVPQIPEILGRAIMEIEQ